MVERQAFRDRVAVRQALGKSIPFHLFKNSCIAEVRFVPQPQDRLTEAEERRRLQRLREINATADEFDNREACPPAAQMVYFFQRRTDGSIKIGTSCKVYQRKADLEMGAGPLTLVGLELGGYEREGQLHRHFQSLRVHGEWFQPGQELLDYLAALRPESERLLAM